MTHKEPKFAPKIALYQPDIPQNTASIIRTCSCLGIMLEIIEPCGFIINDRKFKRVVMDYMDEKEIRYYKSSDQFFDEKQNQRIILMTTKASSPYTEFKFKKNDTILFGRESAGVPEFVHKMINNRLKIPMRNNKRSLNISSSVAIILAECLKQNKLI